MKYTISFQNNLGLPFSISSMDEYQVSASDLNDFTLLLMDIQVRRYITEEAMKKYNHTSPEDLANDILSHSTERWREAKELRFIVRDPKEKIVGIIGVTLGSPATGELWYYKSSESPPFMSLALPIALEFIKKEGIHKLEAGFEPDNLKSKHLLSKIGFNPSSHPGIMSMDL